MASASAMTLLILPSDCLKLRILRGILLENCAISCAAFPCIVDKARERDRLESALSRKRPE